MKLVTSMLFCVAETLKTPLRDFIVTGIVMFLQLRAEDRPMAKASDARVEDLIVANFEYSKVLV